MESLIEKQSRLPDEIVIVNGGGENNCRKTIDYWKTKFKSITVINTKNKNLAVSRNIGLPYCNGDLILQTDDDARPLPHWIEKIINYHKEFPKAGVIGGEVVDESGLSFLSQVADASTFPIYQSVQSVRTVPGVNSSYKKEVIQEVGNYDESLFRGEDVDYNWRAKLKGWDILYAPAIKVRHIHRSNWKDLFKQHFMYGRAHYIVRSKWPNMYSHYPIKISSIKMSIKCTASWTVIPLMDAIIKAKRFNQMTNGFEILILFLVNLSNRVGSFYQRIITIV